MARVGDSITNLKAVGTARSERSALESRHDHHIGGMPITLAKAPTTAPTTAPSTTPITVPITGDKAKPIMPPRIAPTMAPNLASLELACFIMSRSIQAGTNTSPVILLCFGSAQLHCGHSLEMPAFRADLPKRLSILPGLVELEEGPEVATHRFLDARI